MSLMWGGVTYTLLKNQTDDEMTPLAFSLSRITRDTVVCTQPGPARPVIPLRHAVGGERGEVWMGR